MGKARKPELKTMLLNNLWENLQQNEFKLSAFPSTSNSFVQLCNSSIPIGQPIFWLDWTSGPKKMD